MQIRRRHMRIAVGWTVIAVHLVAFFTILFLKAGYDSAQERQDAALLLIPITAAYVTAIVRRALAEGEISDYGPIVNIEFVGAVVLITGGFLAAILFVVFEYSSTSNIIPNVDVLRKYLLYIEIGIGASFGLIVEDLFGKVVPVSLPPGTGPTGP
jgi:hypothetical protein